MPLSDHEQKMLEQLEEALVSEDPKFVSQMRGSHAVTGRRRRWVIGGAVAVLGLVLVLVGVSTTMWVGAAGFALMVAGVAFAVTPPRKPQLGAVQQDGTVRPASTPRGPKQPKKGRSSFMHTLEERWERRQRDGF